MRDLHISYLFLVLPHPQIQVLVVLEEGGVIEVELRDEFLERGGVFHDVVPVVLNALEEPIGFVEPSALQFQHILGLLPHQVADDVAWGRVVTAVHELRGLHALISLQQPLQALLIDCSYWLAEVSVDLGVIEV